MSKPPNETNPSSRNGSHGSADNVSTDAESAEMVLLRQAGEAMTKGLHFLKGARFAEALDCFDRAMIQWPTIKGLHLHRAICLAHLNRWEEARWAAMAELKISPQNPQAVELLRQIQSRIEEAPPSSVTGPSASTPPPGRSAPCASGVHDTGSAVSTEPVEGDPLVHVAVEDRVDQSQKSGGSPRIPVCEPWITEREKALVMECLESGWISSAGRFLDRFEVEWSKYCGMAHGIAVSNGTTALEIAMEMIELAPGDEVILPTFTIISCAQAIVARGGTPVLVDSDPVTWQMDVSQVADRITPRTRAILAVHTYGHPVDMDPLTALAQRHGLTVIEDAAEAHGALYKGRPCGGLADISTFSFYANKLVTTGEGGMVLTNDAAWAERARTLRNLCFEPERRFYHRRLGHNYRFTNLQAALGVAQIERIEEIVARKREIAHAYQRRLADLPMLSLPVEATWARNVYWVYGIVLDAASGWDAVRFAESLGKQGIQTRPFFLGMHEQPVFRGMGLFPDAAYPIAERLARQGLYLPSGLPITETDIATVCDAVAKLIKRGGS